MGRQMDQQEIKQGLLERTIPVQEAFTLLTQQKSKPWKTKAWEEERKKRIGTACVVCGSTERLVLQHLWHPSTIKQLVVSFHVVFEKRYEENHPKEKREEPEPVERNGCPCCGKTTIRFLKSFEKWNCQSCGRYFEMPKKVFALTPEQKRTLSAERKARATKWYEAYHAAMDEEVIRQALLKSIEQHERYMSCIDTQTFCQRCAYLWDLKKIREKERT